MFAYEISIHRERFKRFPILPIAISMVFMGSIMFGSSSDDLHGYELKYTRDIERFQRSSSIGGSSNCSNNLAISNYATCSEFCSILESRLKEPEPQNSWKTINTILVVLFIFLFLVSFILCIAYFCCCLKFPETVVVDVESAENSPPAPPVDPIIPVEIPKKIEKSGSMPVEASCLSLTGDTPVEKFSVEEGIDPVDVTKDRVLIAGVPRRPQIPKQDQLLRDKAIEHGNKMRTQHLKDTDPKKFPKQDPIFIPRAPDVPPPSKLPIENIILDNVNWDQSMNELIEIGSDIDNIELEPSTSIDSSRSMDRVRRQSIDTDDLPSSNKTKDEGMNLDKTQDGDEKKKSKEKKSKEQEKNSTNDKPPKKTLSKDKK